MSVHVQVSPPRRLPSVYIQACTPEGRVRLRRMLAALQPHSNSHPAQPDTTTASLHTPQGLAPAQPQVSLQGSMSVFANRREPQQPCSSTVKPAKFESGSFSSPETCAVNGPQVDACMAGSAGFWEAFGSSIHVLCLSEAKHALMAQSLVGVPGAMTLLCNLSTTVDFGLDTSQEHVSIRSLQTIDLRTMGPGWVLHGLHIHLYCL